MPRAPAKTKRAIGISNRNKVAREKEWQGAQKLLLHDMVDKQFFYSTWAQVVRHKNFKAFNTHLTAREYKKKKKNYIEDPPI